MKNLESEVINFFEVNIVNHVSGVRDTFSDTFSKQLKEKIFDGNSEVLRNHFAHNKIMPDSIRAPQA